MGYGTHFMDYASRITKRNLDEEIEACELHIKMTEEELKVFAYGSPRDTVDDAGNPYRWEEYAPMQVNLLLEELQYHYVRLHQLQVIKEQPESLFNDELGDIIDE